MLNTLSLDDPPSDVVAIGAHPDDVEVACGGTLAKLSDQGYRVGIIDLTDGEPTPHSTGVHQRMEEAEQAGQTLGVAFRVNLGLPNRKLFDDWQSRLTLAKSLRLCRPSIVLGFGEATPHASPDHWQAKLLTDAAVFYTRLCKWEEPFEGLPPHVIQRQMYYRLAIEPDTMVGECHHVSVDIRDTLERKIEAMKCYRSQFDHKPTMEARVRAAAITTGGAAGVEAAESFVSVRPIISHDLVKTMLPNN